MIAVTFLYPRTDDSTFDMDYYCATHMPMLADALGDACQGWGAASIARGKYAAMGWASVESMDAFKSAMAEHGGRLTADVPNFTNVQNEVLIGEVAGGSQ